MLNSIQIKSDTLQDDKSYQSNLNHKNKVIIGKGDCYLSGNTIKKLAKKGLQVYIIK